MSTLFRMGCVNVLGLTLMGCAAIYSDRSSEPALKDLAKLGGLATELPKAQDFVVESRKVELSFIPVGIKPTDGEGKRKPMTKEELLLLKKKLEASQPQLGSSPATE